MNDNKGGEQKLEEKENNNSINSKVAIVSIFIFIGLYSFLIFYARSKQRSTFFQPDAEMLHPVPQDFKEGRYKGISYWYLDCFGPLKQTILFFHGSTGNISYNDPIIYFAKKYEFNLLMIDYRGYGGGAIAPPNPLKDRDEKGIGKKVKEGGGRKGDDKIKNTSQKGVKGEASAAPSSFQPTEASLYEDAQNAYEFLTIQEKISPSTIIVWGNSLGGLAASYVASINNGTNIGKKDKDKNK
jgi:pimeloyl-ACP methyl ester carboxylesterase